MDKVAGGVARLCNTAIAPRPSTRRRIVPLRAFFWRRPEIAAPKPNAPSAAKVANKGGIQPSQGVKKAAVIGVDALE